MVQFSTPSTSSSGGRERSGSGGHASFRGAAPHTIPRMVRRNLVFDQSKNTIRVKHSHGFFGIFWLVRHDWFHSLLRFPTMQSLTCLLLFWTFLIMVFAWIYMAVDRGNPHVSCGLGAAGDPIHFGAAFAFSLETCTTVGYGLPSGTNAFFENCQWLQAAIYFQMVWSMLFNAFLFAFFYNRVGRSESRALQVLIAQKAIVSVINGSVRFQVRIVDTDSEYPVVEAHVRFYALPRQRPVPRPLRIVDPDDDLGAFTLLSFPTVISHDIDLYSMLHPMVEGKEPISNPSVVLRQADSAIGSRDDVICPVCGESYGTQERWISHVRYQQIVEEKDEYPIEGTHLSLKEEDLSSAQEPTKDLQLLQEHFKSEISEIICVVEGIDPLMSGTFQALQSYRYEDIVWNEAARYSPCLKVEDDYIVMDLNEFHRTEHTSVSARNLKGPHDALLLSGELVP